jgi:cysteine-rich repeat protein
LRLVSLFAALVATSLAARDAGAHAQAYPMAGVDVLIQSDQGPGSQAFSFTGTHGVPVNHNPAANSSAVLVRGVGASGGRTEAITLNPALWTNTGSGWLYTDPSGARGGITRVSMEPGVLEIDGKLENWTWFPAGPSPAGPQDEVWVHFRVEDEWYCAQFPGGPAGPNNQAGHFAASGAPAPGSCPAPVCGNGIHEAGEGCDDGNLETGDGCEVTCLRGSCTAESFESTFEGIQKVIFDSQYGCTNDACHGVAAEGGLDLRKEESALPGVPTSYLSLLGPDGLGAPSSEGLLKRVLPNEPDESRLFLKLKAKKPGYTGPDVGTGMPTGLFALSDDHLEAMRLWIRGGAPLDLVVPNTAELLGTCFPPSDPLKTPPPEPPPMQAGFQLQQTPYPLLGVASSQGETELCMATYYDLSSRVPLDARVPCPEQYQFRKGCVPEDGDPRGRPDPCQTTDDCGSGEVCEPVKNASNPTSECFAYDRLRVIQDPQSHHSIVNIYTGAADTNDPGWDDPETAELKWSYKFEPTDPRSSMNGQECDPLAIDPDLGYNPGCSSEPQGSIACVGYGPNDLGNLNLLTGGGGGNLPQLSLSQEVYYDFAYPDGVYNVIPLRGIVVWNSHAFNLTQTDSTMAQFVNVEYAPAQHRQHESQDIFEAGWIFAQFVEPFQKKEICATYTAPKGARIFQLSSHTHRHGTQWRTWLPPNTPCRPACPTPEDDPYMGLFQTGFANALCDPNSPLPLCSDLDGDGHDADDYPPDPAVRPPEYFSTAYEDPQNLKFDPPLAMDSDDEKDRTFLYCSVFDNGSPTAPPHAHVKRWSTSPFPPPLFLDSSLLEFLGGPCYWQSSTFGNVACLNEGPKQGQNCFNPALYSQGSIDGFSPGADHDFCNSPGQDDGVCDACPVHGGVTTEDEMFILLGNYYLAPEPDAAALGAVAMLALAALAQRSRRRSQE